VVTDFRRSRYLPYTVSQSVRALSGEGAKRTLRPRAELCRDGTNRPHVVKET